MNNQLAELQTKLDHAQNEAHNAENDWNHIQTTAAGKTLLIGETRMAIRNLYQLVLKHQNKEHEKNVDVDTDYQLKKVTKKTYLLIIKLIKFNLVVPVDRSKSL